MIDKKEILHKIAEATTFTWGVNAAAIPANTILVQFLRDSPTDWVFTAWPDTDKPGLFRLQQGTYDMEPAAVNAKTVKRRITTTEQEYQAQGERHHPATLTLALTIQGPTSPIVSDNLKAKSMAIWLTSHDQDVIDALKARAVELTGVVPAVTSTAAKQFDPFEL
jgi:hypothetical protein